MNERVNTYFAVKYKRPVKSYARGYMFSIGLSDKTGEIDLTYWGGQDTIKVQEVWSSFETGDVVTVNGNVSEYNDRKKIDVNKESGLVKATYYNIENFVARSKQDPEKMIDLLKQQVSAVSDPHLSALLKAFFEDPKFTENFKHAPAAMYMHHAYIGGLLEHTLHVLQLCASIHRIYPSMSRDLLVTGAVLHDIGKIKEFKVGTSIQVTEEGMLRGHIALGEEMILEKIKEIPEFPQTLKMKVAHMMLSHHGLHEYGSPKTPQFPEAAAVHYADETDSKIDQYVTIKDTTDSRDFRIYTKRLGELYLK